MKSRFSHKGLYAIVDATIHASYGLIRLLRDIVEDSQIPVIQLRLKETGFEKKNEIVRRAFELKAKRDFTLILNNDIEFMTNEKIDGLHLGQEDMAFSAVRKTWPEKILGLSTHNLKQALNAEKAGATYIGCGSVFPSHSKQNAVVLGLRKLKETASRVKIPKVAIGGIHLKNIPDVARSGCEMAAVISALIVNDRFEGQKLHETFLANS